jgi:hypothetical protein
MSESQIILPNTGLKHRREHPPGGKEAKASRDTVLGFFGGTFFICCGRLATALRS